MIICFTFHMYIHTSHGNVLFDLMMERAETAVMEYAWTMTEHVKTTIVLHEDDTTMTNIMKIVTKCVETMMKCFECIIATLRRELIGYCELMSVC